MNITAPRSCPDDLVISVLNRRKRRALLARVRWLGRPTVAEEDQVLRVMQRLQDQYHPAGPSLAGCFDALATGGAGDCP